MANVLNSGTINDIYDLHKIANNFVIESNNFHISEGSWTFITEDYIFIGDEDTSDDKILWKLFNVSGGFIVSRKASDVNTDSNSIEICDPSKWTITRLFTQSQVISKHVAFVAQGLFSINCT